MDLLIAFLCNYFMESTDQGLSKLLIPSFVLEYDKNFKVYYNIFAVFMLSIL